MPIDQSKLKEFQEDLNEKGNGPSTFFNASKIEGEQEFRILDPLENMDGLYALEVNFWWIGKTKVNTPGVLTGEDDKVQLLVDEAKAANDPELDKLLDLRDKYKKLKLRKQTEYWIPGLLLDWDIENDQILGIWNDDDSFNLEAVTKYVRDGEAKILTSRIQLMKAINRVATGRGGSGMFPQDTGFNINLIKAEEAGKVTYTANKSEAFPMPPQFYGEGTPDIVNICKASMFTDEYIDKLIGEYLYGEKLDERTEADYRFPEIRASLKKDAAPAEEAKPSRPTRTGVKSTTAPVEAEAEAPVADEAPAKPSRAARKATTEDVAANTTAAPAPTRGAKKGTRNMQADMQDV